MYGLERFCDLGTALCSADVFHGDIEVGHRAGYTPEVGVHDGACGFRRRQDAAADQLAHLDVDDRVRGHPEVVTNEGDGVLRRDRDDDVVIAYVGTARRGSIGDDGVHLHSPGASSVRSS